MGVFQGTPPLSTQSLPDHLQFVINTPSLTDQGFNVVSNDITGKVCLDCESQEPMKAEIAIGRFDFAVIKHDAR
jgi:hypothetical protein